ncbi:hypothetical protein ACOME3_004308 [Neoechinorhynchus agilis]
MAAETESYRLELARERIKENPSAVDAWSVLLSDAKKRSVDDTRDFFESLVSQFPTCGRYWKSYIEAELTAKNFEFVEKLFHRCLMNVPHVELWMCYLKYLTENKSSIRNFRQIIIDAYEFALQKLGRNPFSTPIWIAYIDFLNISISSPNEFHKIREVYGDALSTPLIGIEQLWDTFCRFEMSISGSIDVMNTKIDEHARTYEKMKRAAHEIERMLRTIEIGGPSTAPAWTSNSSQIVKRWQTYIDWEKSNPLRLSDNKTLAERVMHAYEQCLLSLGTYLQDSALVHFALADLEESQNNMSAAEAVYERYIDKRSIDPTLAYIMLMRFICRRDGVVNAREVFRRARDDRRCSCHIYEAAAEMEFQCNPENGHEVGCRQVDGS